MSKLTAGELRDALCQVATGLVIDQRRGLTSDEQFAIAQKLAAHIEAIEQELAIMRTAADEALSEDLGDTASAKGPVSATEHTHRWVYYLRFPVEYLPEVFHLDRKHFTCAVPGCDATADKVEVK